MKLTFTNKTDFETDVIIDFLNQENIRYHTKLIRKGFVDIYDIEVDTTYEHFMFINKLVKDKLEPYFIAMRSFLLPSYEPERHNFEASKEKSVTLTINGINVTPFESESKAVGFTFTPFEMPPIKIEKRENVLFKLIKKMKWIK